MNPLADMNIAAKRLALDVIESGLAAWERMKSDARSCEERHAKFGAGGPHPCPSYVHCLIGVGKDVWGKDCAPWPVCPITVVRLVNEFLDKAEKLR